MGSPSVDRLAVIPLYAVRRIAREGDVIKALVPGLLRLDAGSVPLPGAG